MEPFFDYGYSKENSKVLYSNHKMRIPNSFSATIFNRHQIHIESLTLNFQGHFFLPSTTDQIEDINRYINSVNLVPTDINQNKFEAEGRNFDPSKLDFDNPDRKKQKSHF